jgi:hypothetical protein
VRRLHYGAVEEAEGRGAVGNGGMAGGRPAAARGRRGGAVLEVEDALTCGPHTSAGQRERGRGGGRSGPRGPKADVGRAEKKGKGGEGEVGRGG